MKTHLIRLLTVAVFSLALGAPLRAADEALTTRLAAVDDARVAATRAADHDKLVALLSDELRYAHSSGNVDTKTSLIESLTSGHLKYAGFDYEERKFTFPAPTIALMTGRAHIKAETATGTTDAVLGFLAVYREEQGQWRFLAWQSCKLPAPAPAPAAK
jgi:hypothetical protein